MTFGKNLSGFAIQKDRQQLITRLKPRGSGSTPSEVAPDNPGYWPPAQVLELNRTDSDFAYFRLPKVNDVECSVYLGDPGYGDGWPINTQFCVGKNLDTEYNLPVDFTMTNGTATDWFVGSLGSPNDAVAQVFYNWVPGTTYAPKRIYDVSLNLQRSISDTPTQWDTQPRFVVGLYTITNTGVNPTLQGTIHAPYQGPLAWCYGNLLSIDSTEPQWYTFPMQAAAYPVGYYAIVVMPYPTSNKQWSNNDYLVVNGSATYPTTCFALQCRTGVSPKSWDGAALPPATDVYKWQYAFKLRTYQADVTTQFQQSGNYQGREVKTPMTDYDPSATYYFHYQSAGYLQAWDAYEKYGHYEGTLKDDTLTTQTALLQAGAQYLQSMCEPSMTISLGASDLYDLNPDANWSEELTVGAPVMVIDDLLGLEQQCVITKIDKSDLTQPHVIDTLTLNNVHLSAQKLLAQLAKTHQKVRNYQQGQTVETPYTTSGSVSSGTPATMQFYIRDATTLTHSVRLTVDTPGTFQIYVDGNSVNSGLVFSGMNEVDVMDALTQAHNGQPTPGVHTVSVYSA